MKKKKYNEARGGVGHNSGWVTVLEGVVGRVKPN